MDNKQRRDKTRASYFGNVKTRLGTKLPAGVTQPVGFVSGPWESSQTSCGSRTPNVPTRDDHQAGRGLGRPLHHVPHIRNPRLRQYYLKEATWLPENPVTAATEESGLSDGRNDHTVHPDNTVFSVASQLSAKPADTTKLSKSPSATLIPRQQLRVPESKAASSSSAAHGSSPTATHPDPSASLEPDLEAERDPSPATSTTPLSPSTDAEYDKLLDVEAVPMPDGQLCLLALPPECTQGEGPASVPYLKLFCRYITDRKGVVSGILLVTSNKIFFDPCKSHPLVMEHGCEEYLLSCMVDGLASVSFYSDISRVHFNASTQRWKGRKKAQRCTGGKNRTRPGTLGAAAPYAEGEAASGLGGGRPGEDGGESRDMAEAERQLDGSPPRGGVAVLSSAATFCCGGQEAASRAKVELAYAHQTQRQPCLKSQMSGLSRPSMRSAGALMFVRLRQKLLLGKKKGLAALELGKPKTPPSRDAWFALLQESSDELYAYLSHCKPDLCIHEGGDEEEADRDEEDFVLLDDGEPLQVEEEEEEEEEEGTERDGRAGEDWEMVFVEDGGEKTPLVLDRGPEGLDEILKQSCILDASHVRELSSELPPRTVGHTWQLAYSTSRHGASLKTLYRKLSGSDSPTLIIIKDSNSQMFGSFLSHPLRPSEKFYGTGETFLFLLHPRFKCFRWTGENSFFIKGDLDSFAIGGGSGHFGLWLDETLYLGRSSPCYTFNNCCLSETDDFRVIELEAWTFC